MTTITQLRDRLDAADTEFAEAFEAGLMTEDISLRHWKACNDYFAAIRVPLLAIVDKLNMEYADGPTVLVDDNEVRRYIADHDAAKARLDLLNRAGPTFYTAIEYADAFADEEHAEQLTQVAFYWWSDQKDGRRAIQRAHRSESFVAIKRTMLPPDGFAKTGKTVRGADGVRVPVVEVKR